MCVFFLLLCIYKINPPPADCDCGGSGGGGGGGGGGGAAADTGTTTVAPLFEVTVVVNAGASDLNAS